MFIRVYINGDLMQEKDIQKDVVTVGRANTADIRIKLPEISSEHVEISENDNGFLVIDKNSMNGSFIDHQKLKPFKTYELIKGVPFHLAKSVALEVVVSSPDNVLMLEDSVSEGSTSSTSTEKLGLDFTGLNKIKKPEKAGRFKPRPLLPKVETKKTAEEKKSYLLEIIGGVIIAALIYTYMSP